MDQNEEYKNVQHDFSGEWLPDELSAIVGAKNYTVLRNLRNNDSGKEGIRGYTKINTTAIAHPKLRSGIQLTTPRETKSYVLTHAFNDAGASAVYVNKSTIPNPGDFEATLLHTDPAGVTSGRFSPGPDGTIIYCNGQQTMVWGGDEIRCAGFYTVDDAAGANPKDYSEAVNNTLDTAGNYAPIGGTQRFGIVFTTRPIKAVKFALKTVNGTTATLSAKYWNGSAFTAVSSMVDGTSVGGKTMAQDGWVTFGSTVGSAKPYHFYDIYLYAYLFEISAGSAEIKTVSVNAPFQPMIDVWDGVFRQNVAFYASRSGEYEDYTLETNEQSSVQYPIVATIGGLVTTDHVIIGFEERMSAIKWGMLAGLTNGTAAVATVNYWNGSAWTAVTNMIDGTVASGKSLNQTGVMRWMPPGEGVEFRRELFGITGYFYKISWSATLENGTNHDGTSVDQVTGIPAQKTIPAYKFASMYKGMVMLCNLEAGHQGNRVDFSMPDSADVFNGELSSGMGEQSLYFGGDEPLTCGTQLYNRFGNNIFSTWVAIKAGETFLLNGDSPEDFKIFPVSDKVGCPAPMTLDTAEMGFEMAEDVTRNVAMWLSYSGPVMFDGSVLQPIDKVSKYFNPSNTDCINYAAIGKAFARYDPTFREYNLFIPTGTATDCNVWLVYDLKRQRWFEKNPGDAEFPQAALGVIDQNGARYTYLGIDTGYMMRNEHGPSWDGKKIHQEIAPGDFWPSGDVWQKTLIRRVKILAKRLDEECYLSVTHIADTNEVIVDSVFIDAEDDGYEFVDSEGGYGWGTDGGFITALPMSVAVGGKVLIKTSQETNLLAWCHKFKFELATYLTDKGFQPVGWAYQYLPYREDR